MIICAIPVFWCLNILSSSHFLLRALEWQTETSPLLLRVRGKQWYWVYKLDLSNAENIDNMPVLIGNDKKVTFDKKSYEDYIMSMEKRSSLFSKKYRQDEVLLKANLTNNRFLYPTRNYSISGTVNKPYIYGYDTFFTYKNRASFSNILFTEDLFSIGVPTNRKTVPRITEDELDFLIRFVGNPRESEVVNDFNGKQKSRLLEIFNKNPKLAKCMYRLFELKVLNVKLLDSTLTYFNIEKPVGKSNLLQPVINKNKEILIYRTPIDLTYRRSTSNSIYKKI